MVSAVAALMAAMMVVMSAPAMAQIDFDNDDDDLEDFFGFGDGFFDTGLDQESESGDVSLDFAVSNEEDYASQCVPALQFGNTGNFDNAPTFAQFASELDDFEPEGIDVSFGGDQSTDCSNTIQQSSAASSW